MLDFLNVTLPIRMLLSPSSIADKLGNGRIRDLFLWIILESDKPRVDLPHLVRHPGTKWIVHRKETEEG